jgi:hypothetical protein
LAINAYETNRAGFSTSRQPGGALALPERHTIGQALISHPPQKPMNRVSTKQLLSLKGQCPKMQKRAEEEAGSRECRMSTSERTAIWNAPKVSKLTRLTREIRFCL